MFQITLKAARVNAELRQEEAAKLRTRYYSYSGSRFEESIYSIQNTI